LIPCSHHAAASPGTKKPPASARGLSITFTGGLHTTPCGNPGSTCTQGRIRNQVLQAHLCRSADEPVSAADMPWGRWSGQAGDGSLVGVNEFFLPTTGKPDDIIQRSGSRAYPRSGCSLSLFRDPHIGRSYKISGSCVAPRYMFPGTQDSGGPVLSDRAQLAALYPCSDNVEFHVENRLQMWS